jgi:hypothetical protein
LTPQLADVGFDKDQNPDKAEQLDEWVLRTRIFNPEIRKAYNLMKTNNVETPGAQEQYLGVWSEQTKIEEMQQSKIDDLVNSALVLIQFVPNEQKLKAVSQWADKTFLNSKNLGIRRATIEQIQSRRDEFGGDVVEILEDKYSRAVALGGPETPSRTKDSRPAERTPLADPGEFATPRGSGSDTESDEEKSRSPVIRGVRRTGAARPVIHSEITKWVDRVEKHLRSQKFVTLGSEVKYIQSDLLLRRDALERIVSQLRKKPHIHQKKIEIFEQAISEVTRGQRR